MASIAANEPLKLVAGDRWQWRREDLAVDYPATAWSLAYYFTNASSSFIVNAVADGDHFAVDEAPADHAAQAPGRYTWAAYLSKIGDRVQIDMGTIDVTPNLVTAGTADQRSHAEKVVESIEAVIEGRATKDQESYSIAGRSLSRTSITDLIQLRDRYRAEVARLRKAERIAAGLGHSGTINIRFG